MGVNPYEHFVATLGQKDFEGAVGTNLSEVTLSFGIEGVNHDVGGCACPVTGSIWLEDLAGDLAVAKGSDLEVDGYGLSCELLGEPLPLRRSYHRPRMLWNLVWRMSTSQMPGPALSS